MAVAAVSYMAAARSTVASSRTKTGARRTGDTAPAATLALFLTLTTDPDPDPDPNPDPKSNPNPGPSPSPNPNRWNCAYCESEQFYVYDEFNPGSFTTRGMLLMMLAVGWLLLLMRLGLLSWVARKKRNLLRLRLQIETATLTLPELWL